MIFMAAVIGTARINPIAPHNHPQNSNEIVTAKGFSWDYDMGQLKVVNTMNVNEKGEWVEVTEASFGAAPPRKSVEMLLRRQP